MDTLTISPLLHGSKARLELCLRGQRYEFVDHSHRPCVLICPGGDSSAPDDRETEVLALSFLQAGFQTAVLRCDVWPANDLSVPDGLPLREAAAAVRLLKNSADKWGISSSRITVCGFFAGWHLAAGLGVFGSSEEYLPDSGDRLCRPDAMILCGGAPTGTPRTNDNSLCRLTEEHPPVPAWSLERYVTDDTCPGFLWNAADGGCVPAEDSIAMAEALLVHHIPFELHLFGSGSHDPSSVCAERGPSNTPIAAWFTLALEWLKEIGVGTDY